MKAWILRHWLISLLATLVVGAGIGGGAATKASSEPLLKERLASLRAELADTQEDVASAEDTAESAEADGADLRDEIASLEARLARIDAEWDRLQAQRAELTDLRETLNARAQRVAETTQRVHELERELRAELHRVRTSTIAEGTWQIGVDVEPGVYRARGGSMCYWAILNSLDNFDIANNGGFTANQTVQLTSGWFESHDCGEWKKIG